ncbi:glycosyltransferase family 4 protein [Micromonospora sp. HUAS LYJ1]|uniref:glycosyltransferase family 4 protein n=1 Tax=Micromonospora sp. HUAS LYJ1 TaxID=3061626 RepID=UPI002671939E|nr:glycosyltransferase family 4 protein [Micromonospora sp. HUAS LYJ1]WKU07113.1 glycosyltransferase family 4 protein [Micromonospora sp. HUAS LYJ1]
MKIGIVSQWYPPEPGTFIPASLAEGLAARGHAVRVLTGFPNYPEGRIYPGFRQRWTGRTTSGGVTVRRVPLYPSHDLSPVRRSANYLSFGATSSLAAVRFLADVDVLYVYHPPATAFAAAAVGRLLHRTPVVLHVQDVWPESVTASSMVRQGRTRELLHRSLASVMHRIYRASSAVVVIAPSMRELVLQRGAAADKTHVVLNWADESLFYPVPATDESRRAIGYRDRCTVMYAGNMGLFQDIPGAVRAAAAVDDRVDLVLVGSGLDEEPARALASQLGVQNVRFLGRRTPADMAALYAAADFQLISLRDVPTARGTIPSKLQAALACGSPVLASVPGDCARLVQRDGVGIACPPGDWQALADRFAQAASVSPTALADMGRRARQTYERDMSQRAGIDQIEKILLSAAQERTR